MNTFGDPKIDALAGRFLTARREWERWRDVPRYLLDSRGRIARERAQTMGATQSVLLAEAMAKAGEDAWWSDGETHIRRHGRRVFVATSELVEAP